MPNEMHPSVKSLLRFFEYRHLVPVQGAVSKTFHDLAWQWATQFEGQELTAGLRKLLEAKDCIVRASLGPAEEENR